MGLPRRGYRASILTPRDGQGLFYLEDGLLVVDGAGRIEHLLSASEPAPQGCVVHDLRGSLIIPGFVDAHVHYPQTRVIGSASGPLLPWLESTVFPEESRFTDDDYAREVAEEFVRRAAAVGTTTVLAFSSSSATATAIALETLAERGLRAIVGLTLMDQNCPAALSVPAERAIGEARALAARFQGAAGGLLGMAITPRFALSCSRPLLEAAGALARELDLLVQTHVSENVHEGEATLAAHPIASDYLGVYEAVGLVGPKTVFAHAIHFSEAEWDRVAASGARVAHCPDSNFFLGSGVMKLAEARRRGVPVALGSDVAAGRSFDLRRAIACAHDASLLAGASVEDEVLFELATLGGARVLGLARETGSLELGKDADFLVLDRPAYLTGREASLRLATFGSELAPVLRTYVRGRLVAGDNARGRP